MLNFTEFSQWNIHWFTSKRMCIGHRLEGREHSNLEQNDKYSLANAPESLGSAVYI